jgi:uncharacterized protein (TIGR02680 family)
MTLIDLPHRHDAVVAPDDRWRPTRAGLVGLWHYWDETFTFHDGRLLLRGPNGSGKSMALELLLPFLLDGQATPDRLSSAARSRGGLYARMMAGTSDNQRTGYAWIEFRRGTEVFTLGARLRASASTKTVTKALFTTTQTVGADLFLVDEHRVPLSRQALVEAVGDHGRVTDSASEHRDAVRASLFPGFSADRYDALLNALLALRKEKLSQHLDLDKLSSVMTEALPAIDDHEIASVAEGFERLDRRRDDLELLARDVDEIDGLARRQRDYARAVVAGTAASVRAAESVRDGIVRRQREAADALATAEAELAELVEADAAADRRITAIDGELRVLRDSDTYRSGARLVDLRAELHRTRQDLVEIDDSLERLRAEADAAREAAVDARGRAADADAARDSATRDLRLAADEAGGGAVVDEAVTADDGEGLVRAWIGRQRTALREVRRLREQHGRAVDRRDAAEDRLAKEQERVDGLTEANRAAEEAADTAVEDWTELTAEWSMASASLEGDSRTVLSEAIPDGPDALDAAVAAVSERQATTAALRRDDLDRRRRGITDERGELIAARGRLEEGGLPEIPAPAWRRRATLAGAPFWQLLAVRDGVDPATVDGIEAALSGAGLLDAWVRPDGTVDLPDDAADLVLGGNAPDAGQSLAAVLAPVDDGAVPVAIVDRVLAAIALADRAGDEPSAGAVVIGRDGTFRLGPGTGRTDVGQATLIGATARERHRRAEIARLDQAIDALDAELRDLDRQGRDLDVADAVFAADLDARPTRRPVDDARRAASDSALVLGEARRTRDDADHVVRDTTHAVRSAQRNLTTTASRHHLPTDADGLDTYDDAISRVDETAATWARRQTDVASAGQLLDAAEHSADRASGSVRQTESRRTRIDRRVVELDAQAQAVTATLGADYEDLLETMSRLEVEHDRQREIRQHVADRRPALDQSQGRHEQTLLTANEQLAEAEADRSARHARLLRLHASPLVADAELAPAEASVDGVTATLALARSLGAELEGVDGSAEEIERRSLAVAKRLHDAQAAVGARVAIERYGDPGDWHVIRGSTGGVHQTLGDLRAHLGSQLATARTELAADEESLFERVLAGSIRQALATHIRAANALVDGINAQLGAVSTAAAGVAVRLRWEVSPDQPDAVRRARSLLLRDPGALDPSEREALGDFVRARVDQARAELELHAPWEERLRESLDYRAWHRFTLDIAHRDWEGFKPATGPVIGRLSTGERSIALHLPMLASIAAHYTGADGEPGPGPRLILLDELFAGVDVDNRAQLFGTFTAWDLDAVLTSDHEWCQYETLGGIAIHHLHPAGPNEPVTSTRFTWNGSRRMLDDAE